MTNDCNNITSSTSYCTKLIVMQQAPVMKRIRNINVFLLITLTLILIGSARTPHKQHAIKFMGKVSGSMESSHVILRRNFWRQKHVMLNERSVILPLSNLYKLLQWLQSITMQFYSQGRTYKIVHISISARDIRCYCMYVYY